MLYPTSATTALVFIPPRQVAMGDDRDWLLPAEVQALLGATWTRPRRLRIIAALEEAGVSVDRPRKGVILVDRTGLMTFIAEVQSGARPAPKWMRELTSAT